MSRPERGARRGTLAAALLIVVGTLAGVGAAAEPAAAAARQPSAFCLPILMNCSSPSPSPSPSSGTGPRTGGGVGGPVGGLLGGVGGAVKSQTPGSSAAPLAIGPDASAPVLTTPAGQLEGSSIAISGIHQLGLVTVKRIDGSSFPAVKLVCDDVVITGFSLDVGRSTGPKLVSTADRMELAGHVSIWLDSFTASTLGGLGLTLGTDQTPPPGSELPSRLLRVNLGLVGTTADSISYSNLHQALHG